LPKVLAETEDYLDLENEPQGGWDLAVPACGCRFLPARPFADAARTSSVADIHPRPHRALDSTPTVSAFFGNFFWQKV
jgi:hypothetical protein